MWLPKPSTKQTVVGHRVTALHPEALMHAVDELVTVGPAATHLKIRAGEHLAALLLTAVCGPPTSLDTVGEVDLLFEREAPTTRNWCFGDYDRAAVEVKSFAGSFRQVESTMRLGDSHIVPVRSALEILVDASAQIDRAIAALNRKTEPQTSKNVFLTIHMFDGLAVEAVGDIPILGHRLPDVAASVDLDTLWVLWHPGILTMWCRRDRRWTDVLFAVDDPTSPRAQSADMDVLQQAEDAFLTAIDHRAGSPWLFGLRPTSASEPT